MDLPYGGVIRGPLFSDEHTANVTTRCRKGDRFGALEVPLRDTWISTENRPVVPE
jgi:hypothetical protein